MPGRYAAGFIAKALIPARLNRRVDGHRDVEPIKLPHLPPPHDARNVGELLRIVEPRHRRFHLKRPDKRRLSEPLLFQHQLATTEAMPFIDQKADERRKDGAQMDEIAVAPIKTFLRMTFRQRRGRLRICKSWLGSTLCRVYCLRLSGALRHLAILELRGVFRNSFVHLSCRRHDGDYAPELDENCQRQDERQRQDASRYI